MKRCHSIICERGAEMVMIRRFSMASEVMSIVMVFDGIPLYEFEGRPTCPKRAEICQGR